jgi:ferredoxin
MALIIEQTCINCDMCEPECPNEAISYNKKIYVINPDLCTECVGHYDQPTCIQVCPIDCISTDANHVESPQNLLDKYLKLQSENTN